MDLLGHILTLGIGVVFGMIGSGGSILTIPLLYYFFHTPPFLATSYSLIIIGITATLALVLHRKNKNINFEIGIPFGILSIISVFLTRTYLLPTIPLVLCDNTWMCLSKEEALLLLLSIIMIGSGYCFIHTRSPKSACDLIVVTDRKKTIGIVQFGLYAIGVGMLTGLVGTGGSFLIIPTLIFFSKLSLRTAIGTSLLIVVANSFIGVLSDVYRGILLDFEFILPFIFFALMGLLIGMKIAKKMSSQSIRMFFGWITVSVGCFIMAEAVYKVVDLSLHRDIIAFKR